MDVGVDESIDSTIQLQVGFPCDFDVLHKYLDSPNDEFVPIDSFIDVIFNILVECDLTMCRSMNFGAHESPLVDSTKVIYIVEDFKVDDTCIQVTMSRTIPLYLLHMIVVLLFLRYKTLT